MDYLNTLAEYEKRLRLGRLADKTVRSYSFNLKRFFTYCQELEITYPLIETYLSELIRRGIEKTTWNQIMYSLRAYYRDMLGKPWFIGKLKPRNKIKDIPLKEKILRSIFLKEDLREKAILLLFYDGMLRRSELQVLKVKDINLEKREIYVRAGKGDKDRIATISEKTCLIIRYYLQMRENKDNPYLIHRIGSDRYYVSGSYLYDVVSSAGWSVGCTDWHPHLLRHAGATHAWLETGDLVSISDKLGHSQIQTTMIYLNLTERNLVRRKTRAVSPLLTTKKRDNY